MTRSYCDSCFDSNSTSRASRQRESVIHITNSNAESAALSLWNICACVQHRCNCKKSLLVASGNDFEECASGNDFEECV
eukprot:6472960-Amphidinium_carterae.1